MFKGRYIFNFLIVAALGTLLHFVYDWTGESPVAAVFSAVNESVWEHLKLLFWPVLLVTAFEYIFIERKRYFNGFLFSRFVGLLAGMALITTLYYTLIGVTGTELGCVNIIIFYLAVAFVFAVSGIAIKNGWFRHPASSLAAVLGFLALAILFGIFSFYPPSIGIFDDPSK